MYCSTLEKDIFHPFTKHFKERVTEMDIRKIFAVTTRGSTAMMKQRRDLLFL